MELKLQTNSPEETNFLGCLLAKYLKPGDLVLLYGDLGSGKTTFIQGICRALEVDPDIYITSPTFTIVHLYEGLHTIAHIDLYRLELPLEIEELGISDLLNTHIVLIEWADKLSFPLKDSFLEVSFTYLEDQKREITIIGYGEEGLLLLKALERDEELKKLESFPEER